VRVLEKSHPGSRLALLTDMDTHFDFGGVEDIEVGARSRASRVRIHLSMTSFTLCPRACSARGTTFGRR
jgi:hypothetical protein